MFSDWCRHKPLLIPSHLSKMMRDSVDNRTQRPSFSENLLRLYIGRSSAGTRGPTQLNEFGIERRNFMFSYMSQLLIMMKRNAITQEKIRFWRSTLVQTIGAPIIFMILLFILQQSDYANQSISVNYPPVNPLQGVYKCAAPNPCISIMYTPSSDPFFDSILTTFATQNANRTGESLMALATPYNDVNIRPTQSLDLVPVPNSDFIYNYVSQNPNITSWAISFSRKTTPGGGTNVQYQVWYNVTNTASGIDVFSSQLQALMRGLDEAIITILNNPAATVTAKLDVNMRDWPKVPPIELADTVVQQLGPVFFFCCVMVIFINALSQVLTEKENYLRHGMEVMGLKTSIYWFSEFLSNMCLVFAGTLMTICLGLMLGFTVFRKSNFFVLFFTFFLFGQSMVSFAFFLSTFFRKAQSGVYVGIFVFMVGLIFESFIFSSGFIGYLWWRPTTPAALTNLLSLLPFFNFGAMFLNISTLTTGALDEITNQYIPGNGFQWSDMYQPIPQNLLPRYADSVLPIVPAPISLYYWFLIDIVFYTVLTWYLDQVIPNEFGVSKPLWFFLTPSYWGYQLFSSERNKQEWLDALKNPKPSWRDGKDQFPNDYPRWFSDAAVEKERGRAMAKDQWPSIKVVHLRKEYKDWKGSVMKTAVHDTCVTFEEGKLFALLGQNGAGKSTTLKILSGLTPATYGDALVYGYSLKSQIHYIREMIGICPQHDILFNELTATEHIKLYAGLKGVAESDWKMIIEERLGAVKLLKVANNPVGSFSGGMKRRLSVVIATIGDPKIVFLDEPTTGMDPINRRYVWSFIEKFKKDRVIILTTHSMEEADVLGDRIAIMAHGKIRAYGDPTSLKAKFGTGYKLSIISDPFKLSITKDIVAQNIPECILEDDSAGALLYQFPNSSLPYVSSLIKTMNSNPIFKSWGMSQTTLEQVFLSVIRSADKEESVVQDNHVSPQ